MHEDIAQQVADVITRFNQGYKYPNLKGMTRQARDFIVGRGWAHRSFKPRRYIWGMSWRKISCIDLQEIPADVLWVFFRRMWTGTVVEFLNSPRWADLNIYPKSSRHFTEQDERQMDYLLLELHQAGYIYYERAGTVRRVEIRGALEAS